MAFTGSHMAGKDARIVLMTRRENIRSAVRDRIARLLILLAAILLLGDLVWIFPHLTSLVLAAVRRSPEGTMLGAALALLVAAWVIRRRSETAP